MSVCTIAEFGESSGLWCQIIGGCLAIRRRSDGVPWGNFVGGIRHACPATPCTSLECGGTTRDISGQIAGNLNIYIYSESRLPQPAWSILPIKAVYSQTDALQ